MPSNKNLVESIVELSKELGITTNTEGLNNKALCEVLSTLKLQKEEKDKTAANNAKGSNPPDDSETPDNPPDSPEPKADGKLKVAKGKSLTSLKGILAEGDVVDASCFVGGQETLDELVKKEYIK